MTNFTSESRDISRNIDGMGHPQAVTSFRNYQDRPDRVGVTSFTKNDDHYLTLAVTSF